MPVLNPTPAGCSRYMTVDALVQAYSLGTRGANLLLPINPAGRSGTAIGPISKKSPPANDEQPGPPLSHTMMVSSWTVSAASNIIKYSSPSLPSLWRMGDVTCEYVSVEAVEGGLMLGDCSLVHHKFILGSSCEERPGLHGALSIAIVIAVLAPGETIGGDACWMDLLATIRRAASVTSRSDTCIGRLARSFKTSTK